MIYNEDDGQRAALAPSTDTSAEAILRSVSVPVLSPPPKALPAPERVEEAAQPKRRMMIKLPKKRSVPAAPMPAETAKRQMSTIQFPYVDLDAVVALARAIHDNGGLALSREQLAGAIRQSPASGAFMLKMGAARQFGLVEQAANGKVQLTNLGFQIVSKDEATERAARAAAFLSVPLFRRVYDEFRGRPLPPRPLGLENAFVQFGVAPKQKDNARIVFEKAARQAGFLSVDPNRLIEPITGGLTPSDPVSAEAATPVLQNAPQLAPESSLDPLIQGLVDRLPEPGEIWEPEKRARWLQTLAANFDMVYESSGGGVIVVEVK